VLQVITRIFPVKRGLFEDKVASFWCVLHNFHKVNTLYDQPTQIKMATALTLLGCLPSLFYLYRSPTHRNFLMALFNVSLSFFVFSFHVHEKQIILPLLFFSISVLDFRHFFSATVTVCNFSMCMLYYKERNLLVYLVLTVGYHVFSKRIEACMLNSFRTDLPPCGLVLYNENYKIISQIREQ
jgi:alpha-1,3-glucosyltransferase